MIFFDGSKAWRASRDMVASRISKSVALAFMALGFADCVPRVTIADDTLDGGEGGELATGGNDNSGTGGSSKGGAGGTGVAGSGSGGDAGEAGAGAISGTGGTAGSTCGAEVIDGVAHYPLETYCDVIDDCPETAEDAALRFGRLCPDIPITMRTGCGVRWVQYNGGYTGTSYAFDEASGELIAADQFGDTFAGPCGVLRYSGGVFPTECADVTTCSVCQDVTDVPVCRFDCDCSEPPEADPCFGPESCGCYCWRLAQQ